MNDNALSLRRLKGLWKRFILGSNVILKWQHTGAICAVLAPFVIEVNNVPFVQTTFNSKEYINWNLIVSIYKDKISFA